MKFTTNVFTGTLGQLHLTIAIIALGKVAPGGEFSQEEMKPELTMKETFILIANGRN